MTPQEIYRLLATAECGAYAMSLDQKIMFWNKGAERILGFQSDEVLGRRCYDVVAGRPPGGFNPACLQGCPSIRALRAGIVPRQLTMQMLCASGERKTAWLTPMVVSGAKNDAPLLVHLFDDRPQPPERIPEGLKTELRMKGADIISDQPISTSPPEGIRKLTRRELEILRLVSHGRRVPQIAEELGISPHTVRNHIRNLRQRLNAKTKLDAVMTAMRLGIL
ncbi:MAG: LuxR C-terminal-related transcriptional regulator [bacterium]|nr:LuxR C-terminal-related transcriptional regulator [Acidimicrobiia bacterium]MCY4648955.1 LuxR C-terminal-related transcriptional regulator [bacterium]